MFLFFLSQLLWESKCLPADTLTIWPGYHVEFNGVPVVADEDYDIRDEPSSLNPVTTADDEDSYIDAGNQLPIGPTRKHNWTSNTDEDLYEHSVDQGETYSAGSYIPNHGR